MRVLVFDTETTGLPRTKFLDGGNLHLWPYIVQFSYVILDISSNELIRVKDTIVKIPSNITIPEETTKIHGITNEITKVEDLSEDYIFKKLKRIEPNPDVNNLDIKKNILSISKKLSDMQEEMTKMQQFLNSLMS